MKLSELLKDTNFKCLNPEVGIDNEIENGYVGDLLSWVMANAGEKCAWVTIQTHINIIAVASLLEMSCIIIPEGAEVEAETLERGIKEGLPIITTQLNAFETCLCLGKAGI
jgi:hypothetical protein